MKVDLNSLSEQQQKILTDILSSCRYLEVAVTWPTVSDGMLAVVARQIAKDMDKLAKVSQ